jgi:hypothetical protein
VAAPQFLYKYRSGSIYDLANLSDGKLWFPSPTSFNDPFDCALRIELDDLSDDAVEAVIKSMIADESLDEKKMASLSTGTAKQIIKESLLTEIENAIKELRGVCCFSEVVEHPLMWGHYSNGHRGFCLEFDTSKDPLFEKAHKVKYPKTIPRLDANNIAQSNFTSVMDLVLTKQEDWAYEREWRVLHNEGNHLHGVDRAALTRVYFGARMPEVQKAMIASLLQNTDTKLCQMQIDKSSYKLVKSEDLTYKPCDYRAAHQADA